MKVRFRVKELAKLQGLTSEELAHRSGLKISTIRNLYQNAVEDPGYKTLSAVAKALGVTIEELVDKSAPRGVQSEDIRKPTQATAFEVAA